MPGDRGAPIVADDDGLGRAERVEHANHVADEMKQRVLIDVLGLACLAVAAHVGGDGADSPRRRAPSTDGATNTRIPESRGRGARRVRFRPRRDGSGSRLPRRCDGRSRSRAFSFDLASIYTRSMTTPTWEHRSRQGREAPLRPPSPESTPSIK